MEEAIRVALQRDHPYGSEAWTKDEGVVPAGDAVEPTVIDDPVEAV